MHHTLASADAPLAGASGAANAPASFPVASGEDHGLVQDCLGLVRQAREDAERLNVCRISML
jgi:hypothetical protein